MHHATKNVTIYTDYVYVCIISIIGCTTRHNGQSTTLSQSTVNQRPSLVGAIHRNFHFPSHHMSPTLRRLNRKNPYGYLAKRPSAHAPFTSHTVNRLVKLSARLPGLCIGTNYPVSMYYLHYLQRLTNCSGMAHL